MFRISFILCVALCAIFFTGELMAQDNDFEHPGVQKDGLPLFADSLRQNLGYPLGWSKSVTDPSLWKQTAQAKFQSLLLVDADKAAFNPQIVDEVDRGSYTAKKIIFNVTSRSRVLALVLVPKGKGPFPAALLLHDHGSKFDIGKEKLIQPWGNPAREQSAKAWSEKYFGGRFVGDTMAARGWIVLSVDALGWGDRVANGYEGQQQLAANLFNLGSSLAGIMAVEDVRSAEFLSSLPDVDTKRVAAVGFSLGAFRAWQVGALSDQIKAVVADCWMGTFQGLMVSGNNQLKGGSAWYMIHPGLARYLDYPDIAALNAPKPLLLFNGEADALFPVASVKAAYAKIQAVYKAFGVPDNFESKYWPYGHVFLPDQQDAAFDWLDRQFKKL